MRSRLGTSARVILYINGRPYAAVVAFRWDSFTGKRAIVGIDSMDAYELAPTVNKCTGTLTLLRTVGDGGAEGAGLLAHFGEVPKEKYFSLSLVDRLTDTQLFRADECSATNQSWDVPTKGRILGTLTFEALRWNNESTSV